jgi:hypothetical protein
VFIFEFYYYFYFYFFCSDAWFNSSSAFLRVFKIGPLYGMLLTAFLPSWIARVNLVGSNEFEESSSELTFERLIGSDGEMQEPFIKDRMEKINKGRKKDQSFAWYDATWILNIHSEKECNSGLMINFLGTRSQKRTSIIDLVQKTWTIWSLSLVVSRKWYKLDWFGISLYFPSHL